MGIIRKLVDQQIALSNWFDKFFLKEKFLIDGNRDYINVFLPSFLDVIKESSTVYDVGCGKNPAISLEIKRKNKLKINGIDISKNELLKAPTGALDSCIEADICNYNGKNDGDLVLCQALLEHVPNVELAFKSIYSLLQKDGVALIFVPSRNAVFAQLNNILPQTFKRFLLHGIFPNSSRDQGFPSFYDHCTPKDFRKFSAQYGFKVEEIRTYYISNYFSFCFPLYFVWRLWMLLFEKLKGEQSAETFCMKLRRI